VFRYRCRFSVWMLVFPLMLFSSLPGSGAGKGKESKPKIHIPAEIVAIMQNSPLTYQLDMDNKLQAPKIEAPVVLPNQLYLEKEGEGYSLREQHISKEAAEIVTNGEAAFEKKEYDTALELYLKAQAMAPNYYFATTLIGDIYFFKGEYEKAISFFLKAIEQNFIDCDAHWFLADSYWKLGKKKETVRSLTIAHLLNVNHEQVKKGVLLYRKEAGKPWKDRTYEPRYALEKEGDTVKVKFAEEWIGYALVKALWAYEPGYAESMLGSAPKSGSVSTLEEKEAVVAGLAGNKELEHIGKIIEDGYGNQFILYELFARRFPATIVLLPREEFMRLVEYVEKYH
jgi:tetratricopeptide (TPR) repeat protein